MAAQIGVTLWLYILHPAVAKQRHQTALVARLEFVFHGFQLRAAALHRRGNPGGVRIRIRDAVALRASLRTSGGAD